MKNRQTITAILLSFSVSAIASEFPATVDLFTLDGDTGVQFQGPIPGDGYAGGDVAMAGDINNDGFDDVVVKGLGWPAGGVHTEVYVAYGSADLDSTVNLGALDGSNGFQLTGLWYSSSDGRQAAGPVDLNDDGYMDVVVASQYDALGNTPDVTTGTIAVVYGGESIPALVDVTALNGINGFRIFVGAQPPGDSARIGNVVRSLGDVDGDGHTDIGFSAIFFVGGSHDRNDFYIIFGGQNFPPLTLLNNIDTLRHKVVTCDVVVGCFSDVNAAGDVNGDGYGDIIFGAHFNDPNGINAAGEAYVVYGSPDLPDVTNLSTLSATAGVVLQGSIEDGLFGYSVSAAGYFNDDNYADLVIGSGFTDFPGKSDAGQAFIVYGKPDLGATIDVHSLELSAGFVVDGASQGYYLGLRANKAGDLNNDGFDDAVLHASGGGGEPYRAIVLYGGAGSNPPATTDDIDETNGVVFLGASDDQTGSSLAAGADINNDGADDLLIGAKWALESAGAAYIVFGRFSDTDEDGLDDNLDNCTLVANPLQRDTDQDNYGNFCDPDLNNDGIVDFLDLGLFKDVFLTADPNADFNGDGAVDFVDLAIVSDLFLAAPGPSGLVPD